MRKIIVACLIVCSVFLNVHAETTRPKVAVVLSGGGAKGFAHIGVLDVLEKEGIPVDIIVGTSMGAVMGGLYSIGYKPEQLSEMSLTKDWSRLLSDNVDRVQLDQYGKTEKQRYLLRVPFSGTERVQLGNGLIQGQNVLNLFCELASNVPDSIDFNKLPIQFACIGTDLVSGKEVILNSGFLPKAMLSSMAIPGVFSSVQINDYLLVDGGAVNNFPVDVAKNMGADIIIGVNLHVELAKEDVDASMLSLTTQLMEILTTHKYHENKKTCDILIEPNLKGYGVTSFSNQAADTLIHRGRVAAMSVIDQIRDLKKKYNLEAKTINRDLATTNTLNVTKINFQGNYSLSEDLMLQTMGLKAPNIYSIADIETAIGYLYGMGVFNRTFFNVKDNETGKTLNINIEEKNSFNFNVGMRVNKRSVVSILLNATRKDYNNLFNLLSFTADISTNPRFNFLAEMTKGKFPKLVFSVDGSYFNPNINSMFMDDLMSFRYDIYNIAPKLYTYKRIRRNSLLGIGVKEDIYGYRYYTTSYDDEMSNRSYSSETSFIYYLFYSYDSFDNFYYPTKGTQIYTEFSVAHTNTYDQPMDCPIAFFKIKNVQSLSRRLALITGVNARALFNLSNPMFLQNYLVSNEYDALFSHNLQFYGAPSMLTLEKNNIAIGSLAFRYNIFKKSYVTLAANCAFLNDKFEDFNNYSNIWGFGLTYSYKSGAGPLDISLGYSNYFKKAVVSANIGYWF